MNTFKKYFPWFLLFTAVFVGAWLFRRAVVQANAGVRPPGSWVTDLGGTETILPNYSGL